MTLLLASMLLSAATIHTNFEGGSLGEIQKVSDTHVRLAVKGESDQDHRNRQANWYYFRVDGASSQPLTLDMVKLPGEYNYRPNRGAVTKDTPPVISYDGVHWEHVKTYAYDPVEPKLVLHIQPAKSRFWIAHCAPYTNETLAKLRSEIRGNSDFHEQIIGKTVGGRDIFLWTITHGESKSKKTIWLMFRQHSWESGSSWVGEGAVRALLAHSSAKLREDVIWKIIPLCDPDGVARGGVRFNANGFDLNRNWDIIDPIKMPEITAQRNVIKQWIDSGHHIELLLSLHNTETNEYIEGPPDGGKDGQFKPRVSNPKPADYLCAGSTATLCGRDDCAREAWPHDCDPGALSGFRDARISDGAADFLQCKGREASRRLRPFEIRRGVSPIARQSGEPIE